MTNILIFLVAVIFGLLLYLIFLFKRLETQKFTDFATKLEVSSQLINELKTSIFNSLSLLQNHINQTINQVSTTDSTLRTQLELLRNSLNEQISSTVRNLNLQIKTTTETTSKGFELVSKQIDQRLKGTTEIFTEITQMVSKLSTSAEQLTQSTEELRRSLGSIKLRGNFGEVLLEKLLLEVFPKEIVKFQYHVNPHSEEKVDAAIIFKDKVIPIDAKFNMEKFLQLEQASDENERQKIEKDLIRTIKDQIDKIADKYVLPQYGVDYAFMYIPSEWGFLKVLSMKFKDDENIIRYAVTKRIIISSPQTLLPYLQFVIMGIQTEQIAKDVLNVRRQLESLLNNLIKFEDKYSILGKHLKNAYEKYTDAESDLKLLELQMKNVVSLGTVEETPKLPEK